MIKTLAMAQGTASGKAGDRIARFARTRSIEPFIPNDLAEMITNPIKFRAPSGSAAYGYEATILVRLCDAVLAARRDGKLHYQQAHIAERCEILVRAFAKTGIIALVDEATGYQQFRPRDYCRPHQTLTKAAEGVKTTPAMVAGITDHLWTVEEILGMMRPDYLLQ